MRKPVMWQFSPWASTAARSYSHNRAYELTSAYQKPEAELQWRIWV